MTPYTEADRALLLALGQEMEYLLVTSAHVLSGNPQIASDHIHEKLKAALAADAALETTPDRETPCAGCRHPYLSHGHGGGICTESGCGCSEFWEAPRPTEAREQRTPAAMWADRAREQACYAEEQRLRAERAESALRPTEATDQFSRYRDEVNDGTVEFCGDCGSPCTVVRPGKTQCAPCDWWQFAPESPFVKAEAALAVVTRERNTLRDMAKNDGTVRAYWLAYNGFFDRHPEGGYDEACANGLRAAVAAALAPGGQEGAGNPGGVSAESQRK